jgi:putative transposase
VTRYVRYPLSLRNVEDLLHKRGIDISHETVRFWWNRFGPLFAAEIQRKRVDHMRSLPHWRWYLDEVFVKINGVTHDLWREVDHEGEILESHVTTRRDRKAAVRVLRKSMKRHGQEDRWTWDYLLPTEPILLRFSNVTNISLKGPLVPRRAEDGRSLR